MRYEGVRKYRKVPHKDFISFSYSTVFLKTEGIYLLFRTMYLLLRNPPPFLSFQIYVSFRNSKA